MPDVNLVLPKMGESVHEATIIKWLKNEGDRIEADETVLEIATDKVDSEIPSPAGGILAKKLFKEGDVVKVGTVIAVIASEKKEQVSSGNGMKPAGGEIIQRKEPGGIPPAQTVIGASPVHGGIVFSKSAIETMAVTPPVRMSPGGRFFSPLIRNIAKQENVSAEELEAIPGSGANGRVTKNDLLAYLEKRKKPGLTTVREIDSEDGKEPSPSSFVSIPVSGNDEIIEMDRMRKLIAEHMVMSKRVSAHITSFVEADVTAMWEWRSKVKDEFKKRYNEHLTFTPLFIEAIVRAMRDYPMINSSVDGTKIIIHKNINIGLATALPSGNLIVPVIKNTDHLNLTGITSKVNDLAKRARESKLLPDEIQNGTFTLTNVGSFGNLMGTPIINQPQVAILATGAIRKKPAVIETPQGDAIAIRHMMFLSLSYDHRIIDGALGGSFVRRVADYLEKFDGKRTT